jgi:hypothetical protein
MVDIYINDESLTVLGGPSQVDVSVDYGETGDRGSIIISGYGNPNDLATEDFPQTPQIYDLYVNLRTSDADSGWVYQYVSQLGENVWIPLTSLSPGIYSANYSLDFVDGSASASIPVAAIISGTLPGNLDTTNFNIQYNIINTVSPTISSIAISELSSDGDVYSLPVTISAKILNETVWENLAGENISVHFLITVI